MPEVPVPQGYVRPDPEPAAHLPTIGKSATVRLNDGTERRYSTCADYVEYYVSQGIVRSLEDLVQNYSQLIAETFFQWISGGRLGCLFAVMLARRPRENRWLPIVQLGALKTADLPQLLNAQLDAASESHEAVAIIFPDVVTDEEIAQLINLLCADPSGRWYWTQDGIDPDTDGTLRLIGLRWVLKSGNSVNYVLGFSALSSMPSTRQSPFTAIFLRVAEEKRTPAHREDGRVQVHLADLDSMFHPQDRHDQVSELTKQSRANHVEPHLTMAARARVTFSLAEAANLYLCEARKVNLEKDEMPVVASAYN